MRWKKVLLCSANADFSHFLQGLIGSLDYSLRLVRTFDELGSLEPEYKPDVLVVDCDEGTEEANEKVIQAVRSQHKELAVALLYRTTFNVEALDRLQSGAKTIALQNPFEKDLLLDWFFLTAPVEIPPDKIKWDYLTSVRIPDLLPDERIDFDLYYYMEANKKFLLYSKKDGQLTAAQLQKFIKNDVRDFYVRKNQLPELQKFLARRLAETRTNKSLTETEKKERLRVQAKEVFHSLLGGKDANARESRMVLESCKSVALTFIQDTSDQPEFYQKLVQLTKQGAGNYNHSINVSVFCTLFGMALGEKDLEAAAVVGLLHDIGQSMMRMLVDERQVDKLDEQQMIQLRSHPDFSVRLLKEKTNLGDEGIFRAISEHHEHVDGTGYPRGLKGNQLSSLGRICAIADQFDHLTSSAPNQIALSPEEAVTWMLNHPRFDKEYLKEIQSMFAPSKRSVMSDEQIRNLMRHPQILPDEAS